MQITALESLSCSLTLDIKIHSCQSSQSASQNRFIVSQIKDRKSNIVKSQKSLK
jgi:hypothetical protein